MTPPETPCDFSESPRHQLPDWESAYANTPPEKLPWYLRSLDPDVEQAFSKYPIPPMGHWLDLGTGTGTQALHLYEKGYQVTGSDLSPSAIAEARRLSKHITWVEDDILHTQLTGPYNGILDRGVFHVFHAEERATYIENIIRLLKPEGWLLLKCFSIQETMPDGPYHFDIDDIDALFSHSFTIHRIEPTIFYGTYSQTQHPIQALWCVMQKR